MPLCSRIRPDVRDRHTLDRRQTKASLNAPAVVGGGGIINVNACDGLIFKRVSVVDCGSHCAGIVLIAVGHTVNWTTGRELRVGHLPSAVTSACRCPGGGV